MRHTQIQQKPIKQINTRWIPQGAHIKKTSIHTFPAQHSVIDVVCHTAAQTAHHTHCTLSTHLGSLGVDQPDGVARGAPGVVRQQLADAPADAGPAGQGEEEALQ